MAKEITVALAGNPNSGKTTVFNNLTGARQHTGNWPGKTVEKREGVCYCQDYVINVVDLPGCYSLTAYSLDEVIARDFIVEEKPNVVVNVVDASNLERNLYLTVQLLEMGAPLVLALNMMDEAEARNYDINLSLLSQLLGVPVVSMIATRNQGSKRLLEEVINVAEGKVQVKGLKLEYGHEVEEEITTLEKLISQTTLAQKYPTRWLAIKLLESDEEVNKKFEEVEVG